MEPVKKRDSNIELLRMISMLMIIGHHFSVHGGFFFQHRQITMNMLFLQWLSVGGKIGVNLFVLISGYFMIHASGIRIQKAVKLWLQIFFYSVVIFSVCSLTGLTSFSPKGLVGALFPIASKQWWFASTYFLMYLLSPAINRGLAKLSQKKHLLLLAVLAVLWYVVPVFTWLPERIRDLLWFLSLYCISGYLRLYNSAARCNAGTWLAIGAGLLLLSFGYAVFLLRFLAKSQSSYETAYFQTWQLLMLLTAIPLFLGFLRLRMRNSSVINKLAAASFGVYLIHDSNFLRYPLWRSLLQCASFQDSAMLIPYAIGAVAVVYLACLAIEWLRMAMLDKAISDFSKKLETLISGRISQRSHKT